jgi:hypothetical protein
VIRAEWDLLGTEGVERGKGGGGGQGGEMTQTMYAHVNIRTTTTKKPKCTWHGVPLVTK